MWAGRSFVITINSSSVGSLNQIFEGGKHERIRVTLEEYSRLSLNPYPLVDPFHYGLIESWVKSEGLS
jgi:hypothetical protein